MKKIIITLMISVGLLVAVKAKAEIIKATECTVNTQSDDSGHPHSLRGSLDYGYNRQGTGRACTEVIKFYTGVDFVIKPQAPIEINNENDVDSDVDGNNLLVTKGSATSVTIDGTDESYSEDNCVLDVKNNKVKITGITIKAKKRAKAICGQSLSEGSTPTIIAGDDQCQAGDLCCDNYKYASAGTACTDGTGHAGTCGGTNITCTPTVVAPACPAEDSCCDTVANAWKADGAACDDGDAANNPDICTAHVCGGTTTNECTIGSPCCDNTGHYSPVGANCTDAGEAGTCSATHTCDAITLPVCGNGTTETGETCDDGNTTAGDGCDTNCQTEVPPVAVCGNSTQEGTEVCDGVCCEADCTAFQAGGTACTNSGTAGTCNATTHACDAATTGGGTVTPPGDGSGTTPPGDGSTTPDNSNTTPIDLGGGGSGGGCMLSGSLSSMAPLWLMILGILPMGMIRRKK